MRIKTIHLREFKRFQDLTIENLPPTARLVMLVGPNGSGKSCLFDAFRLWLGTSGGVDNPWEPGYHLKQGVTSKGWQGLVEIEFHSPLPQEPSQRKKLFYIRSAYRNEADFTAGNIQRMASILDAPKIRRLIDNDVTIADNYKRLVSSAVQALFAGGEEDKRSVSALRESFIGKVRDCLRCLFDDLVLTGLGDPLAEGTFFFEKGTSRDFHYKNLSGGEKAAFDLLLDLVTKLPSYNATVFCIDEPDLHMHTRLQGRLLGELFDLVPPDCQLWIATHSIGMMRRAMELYSKDPGSVVFLDFQDDFDIPRTLAPASVDRSFWARTLSIALGDLADLVAPKQVVLCEGDPAASSDPGKAEFDARCYRKIFCREFPETDFISVGNDLDVRSDRLKIGYAIQTLVSGTKVIRLVDRDSRTPQEIADLEKRGIRVLSRRNLEGYLLDDEVLVTFCKSIERAWDADALLDEKQQALADGEARGNAPDDLKSVAGNVYAAVRKTVHLPQLGNSAHAFMRDTLAPLVMPGTEVYRILRQDIFGK